MANTLAYSTAVLITTVKSVCPKKFCRVKTLLQNAQYLFCAVRVFIFGVRYSSDIGYFFCPIKFTQKETLELGWKLQPVTNMLAYYTRVLINTTKAFEHILQKLFADLNVPHSTLILTYLVYTFVEIYVLVCAPNFFTVWRLYCSTLSIQIVVSVLSIIIYFSCFLSLFSPMDPKISLKLEH